MALFFSVDSDVRATGITFGGGYYWLPGSGDKIYAYNTDGTRSSGNDIDLDSANTNPRGIAYYDDKLWVVDNGDDKVYVYNTNGTRSSGNDFDLDNANTNPTGITYHDNKFWVVDRNK